MRFKVFVQLPENASFMQKEDLSLSRIFRTNLRPSWPRYAAIHRINHYLADKYYGNQLRYPLVRDLSGG